MDYDDDTTMGLNHYLSGMAEYEDVVYSTNIPNGYMVPCTQLLENPSALLEDVRFKELLNTLSENYRFVIIDSPPLGSVADGALIASLCDGAVLVVRAGTTPRTLIKQSLYEIQQSGCKLLGTVLNRADVKGRAYGKYGYGKYGYGYGYGYGYEPKDKKKTALTPLPQIRILPENNRLYYFLPAVNFIHSNPTSG